MENRKDRKQQYSPLNKNDFLLPRSQGKNKMKKRKKSHNLLTTIISFSFLITLIQHFFSQSSLQLPRILQ